MKNNRASLLLKTNQQALQRRAAQQRAKQPAQGDIAAMTIENLEALAESDGEQAQAAAIMLAYYFPESENTK